MARLLAALAMIRGVTEPESPRTTRPIPSSVMSSEARHLQQPMVTEPYHVNRREPDDKIARCARNDTRSHRAWAPRTQHTIPLFGHREQRAPSPLRSCRAKRDIFNNQWSPNPITSTGVNRMTRLLAALAMTREVTEPEHREQRAPSPLRSCRAKRDIFNNQWSPNPITSTGVNRMTRLLAALAMTREVTEPEHREQRAPSPLRSCRAKRDIFNNQWSPNPITSTGVNRMTRLLAALAMTREVTEPEHREQRAPSPLRSCRAKRDIFNNQWSPNPITSTGVNRMTRLLAALAMTREVTEPEHREQRAPSPLRSCRAKRDIFNNQWSPNPITSTGVNRMTRLLAALAMTREVTEPEHREQRAPSPLRSCRAKRDIFNNQWSPNPITSTGVNRMTRLLAALAMTREVTEPEHRERSTPFPSSVTANNAPHPLFGHVERSETSSTTNGHRTLSRQPA